MSRIIQFSKYNWKKLALVAAPIIYGANYVKGEYLIYNHMRHVCNVVNQCSSPKTAKVLVILNPVANKKRCEKMFKKYCEPVLHIAGYSVDVIKTKHIGNAKSVMNALIQLPDAVVVAGGDGTSSEVITGLLRRNTDVCPVLFLPLGEKNKTASGLIAKQHEGKIEFVKYLSHFVLALVKEQVKWSPVVKYEIIQIDAQQEDNKPIFGLQGLSWGILSDIEIRKEKYWYLGCFKYLAAVMSLNLHKKFDKDISASLYCTPPCYGCNKCVTTFKNKRYSNLSNLFKLKKENQPLKEERLFASKACGIETLYNISGKQIDIKCSSNMHSFFELNANVVRNIPDRATFAIKILKKIKIEPTVLYKGNSIKLYPLNSEHHTYFIDGEGYDARPIKISFLPNALKCFC